MDPYNNPDQQSEATILAMITRLEERGQHPIFLRMIAAYAAQVRRDQPLRVLELGCGTGVVIRFFETILHDESALIGADISLRLLEAAKSMRPNSRVHWDHIAPGRLPYENSLFDVVVMHTLLSHVPDPEKVLLEAARILKQGGRLIIFDADHASTTYGLPDYARMRAADQKLADAIATHPDICRQLPRLLKRSGFRLENHHAEIVSECGRGDFWLSSVRGFARLIPALGILPEVEGRAWVNDLLSSHEEGTFFAAGSYYTFSATTASDLQDHPQTNSHRKSDCAAPFLAP